MMNLKLAKKRIKSLSQDSKQLPVFVTKNIAGGKITDDYPMTKAAMTCPEPTKDLPTPFPKTVTDPSTN
ncbi:hypothetical protein AAEU28_08110 [Pseudoalteromonas sp. SS15]|uniref:hypothetical protein n=1 Tax=Pseudoalteromonas sp. SS15 TaxID=3139393 RepID=UPI003BACD08A